MSDGRAGQSREVAEQPQVQPQPEKINWFERNWESSLTLKVGVGVVNGYKMTDRGLLPNVEIVMMPAANGLKHSDMAVDPKNGAASLMSEDGKRVVFTYSPNGENDKFEWKGDVLSKITTSTQTFTYDSEKSVWLIKNNASFSPAQYDAQSKVHCAHFKSGEVEKTFELTGAVTIERLADSYKQFVAEAKVVNAYLTPEKMAELQAPFAVREGDKEYAYKDSLGYPTVGIGFNLAKSGARERIAEVGADYDALLRDAACPIGKKQTPLTAEQKTALFHKDLALATGDAASVFPELTLYPQKVQDVLVDLSFNMGPAGLRSLERFNAAIKGNHFVEAGTILSSYTYARQTGIRARDNVAALKECGNH